MSDKKNCFIPLEFISDIQTTVIGINEQFALYFLEMVIKTDITFILFFQLYFRSFIQTVTWGNQILKS